MEKLVTNSIKEDGFSLNVNVPLSLFSVEKIENDSTSCKETSTNTTRLHSGVGPGQLLPPAFPRLLIYQLLVISHIEVKLCLNKHLDCNCPSVYIFSVLSPQLKE